jgi:hypothetical protein
MRPPVRCAHQPRDDHNGRKPCGDRASGSAIRRQVIRIHTAAVVVVDGLALDQQVATAMRTNVAQRHGLEVLELANAHIFIRSAQNEFPRASSHCCTSIALAVASRGKWESLTLHFPLNLKLYIARRSPRSHPSFGLAFGYIMYARFLGATTVAAAIAPAGCATDGSPPSTGDSGSVSSFVGNLFRSKSDDQPLVPHNEVPVPSAPQTTAKLPPRPTGKTGTEVPRPALKQQTIAERPSPPESAAPPVLSGAAPTLPSGSFDNGVGSRH